ncbi:hypothetical protein B0H14DRAFT_2576408 [Mycena olivaceomarginata]|nr:hypothetical protein B0H14DRAFT_2576408 [Mycena olivaceomarginata]
MTSRRDPMGGIPAIDSFARKEGSAGGAATGRTTSSRPIGGKRRENTYYAWFATHRYVVLDVENDQAKQIRNTAGSDARKAAHPHPLRVEAYDRSGTKPHVELYTSLHWARTAAQSRVASVLHTSVHPVGRRRSAAEAAADLARTQSKTKTQSDPKRPSNRAVFQSKSSQTKSCIQGPVQVEELIKAERIPRSPRSSRGWSSFEKQDTDPINPRINDALMALCKWPANPSGIIPNNVFRDP